jgi:hypothetical protein
MYRPRSSARGKSTRESMASRRRQRCHVPFAVIQDLLAGEASLPGAVAKRLLDFFLLGGAGDVEMK